MRPKERKIQSPEVVAEYFIYQIVAMLKNCHQESVVVASNPYDEISLLLHADKTWSIEFPDGYGGFARNVLGKLPLHEILKEFAPLEDKKYQNFERKATEHFLSIEHDASGLPDLEKIDELDSLTSAEQANYLHRNKTRLFDQFTRQLRNTLQAFSEPHKVAS